MTEQQGGKIAKAVTQDLDSTLLKAVMETTLLCVLRENVPPLLCFSSSSSGHTFFSEETPSLKMEPKRLSQFPLLSGEEFV